MPRRDTRYKRGGKKGTHDSSTNPVSSYTKAKDNTVKLLEMIVPSEGFARGGSKRSYSKRSRGGKRYRKIRLKSGGTRGSISSPSLNNREHPILGRIGDGPFESKVSSYGPYGPQGSTVSNSTRKVGGQRPGALKISIGRKKYRKNRRKYTRRR